MALVILASLLAGCSAAPDAGNGASASTFTFTSLREGDSYTFLISRALNYPWVGINVTVEVEGPNTTMDGFLRPHQAVAVRYTVPMGGGADGAAAVEMREIIGTGFGRAIVQTKRCVPTPDSDPEDVCLNRTIVYHRVMGQAGGLGASPFLALGSVPASGSVQVRESFRYEPHLLNFTVSPAPSEAGARCIQVAPEGNYRDTVFARGDFQRIPLTFLSATLTFCEGIPLPTVISDDQFELRLQRYQPGGGALPLSAGPIPEAGAPLSGIELAPWNGAYPPDGTGVRERFPIQEAVEWAKLHVPTFGLYLAENPGARLQGTLVEPRLAPSSTLGPSSTSYVRELRWEGDDPSSGFYLRLVKTLTEAGGESVASITQEDARSEEVKPFLVPRSLPERLVTLESARQVVEKRFALEHLFTVASARAQGMFDVPIPLQDHYLYSFGLLPIEESRGASQQVFITIPYRVWLDAELGSFVQLDMATQLAGW